MKFLTLPVSFIVCIFPCFCWSASHSNAKTTDSMKPSWSVRKQLFLSSGGFVDDTQRSIRHRAWITPSFSLRKTSYTNWRKGNVRILLSVR